VGSKTAKIGIDESVLVEQARRGDAQALERLMLRYQDRIFNVILKICANYHDAAELTQETFVKIVENIPDFEGRSGFYTWAFRIAVNLTITHCRRKAKGDVKSLNSEVGAADEQAKRTLAEFLADEHTPDPAEVASNNELCDIALRLLMKLDEQQRTVVVLRDIEGMNYLQIARVLDVGLGTVKSRLSRARGSLRRIMEGML